jgi:hypothetical protein
MWQLQAPNQNSSFGVKIEPLWMSLSREISKSTNTDSQIRDIAISEGINVNGKDRNTISKELGIFYEERLKKEGGGEAVIDSGGFSGGDNIFDGAPDEEEDNPFRGSDDSYDGGDLKKPFSEMRDDAEKKEEDINPFATSEDEDLSDPFGTDKDDSLTEMLKRGDEDDDDEEMNPFQDDDQNEYDRDNFVNGGGNGGGNCDWDYNQGVNLGYGNMQDASEEAYKRGYEEALLALQDEQLMAYQVGLNEGEMLVEQSRMEAFQQAYQIAGEERNQEMYFQGMEQGRAETYQDLDEVYERDRDQAYYDGYNEAQYKYSSQLDEVNEDRNEAYQKGKEAAISEFRKKDDDYRDDDRSMGTKRKEDDYSDRKYKDNSDDEMTGKDSYSSDKDEIKREERRALEEEKEAIAQAERQLKDQEYKQLEEELNLVSQELQEPVMMAKALMERVEKVARKSNMEVEQAEENMDSIKEMTGLMSKHKEIYNKWASGLMSTLGSAIGRNLEYEIEDVEKIRKNVNKINMINDIRMATIIEFDQAKKDIKKIINSVLVSTDIRGVYTLYKIKYRFDVSYNRVMEYNNSRISQLWGRAWTRLGKFDSGDIIPEGIEEAGKTEVPKIETILVKDLMPTMAEVEVKMKRAKYIKDNTGDKNPKEMIKVVKTLIEETKEDLEEYNLLDEIVVKSMVQPLNVDNPAEALNIPLPARFVFGVSPAYLQNIELISDNIVKFRTPPKPLVHDSIDDAIYKDPTKAADAAMLNAEEEVSLDKIEGQSAKKSLEAQFKSDILNTLHEFSNKNMEKVRAIQEETETAKSKAGFTKSNISDDTVIEVLKTRRDLKNHIQTTNEVINSAIKDAVFSLIPEMSTIKDNFNTAVIVGVQHAVNQAPRTAGAVTNLITDSGIAAKKKAIELNMYPKYVQGAAATAAAIVSNYYQLAIGNSVNVALPAAAKAAVEAGADSSTMAPALIANANANNIADLISSNAANAAQAYAGDGTPNIPVIEAIRRAVAGNIGNALDPLNLVHRSLLAAIVTSAVSSNLAVHSIGAGPPAVLLAAAAQLALEGKKPTFRILTDAIASAIDNDNTGFIGGVKISNVKTLMVNVNQSVSRSIEELPPGGYVYAEAVLESKKADESAENAIELVASVSQPAFIQAVTVAKIDSKEANEKLLDAALDINRRKMDDEYRIVGPDVVLIHQALKNIISDGDNSITSVINTIRVIDDMINTPNRLPQQIDNVEIDNIINTENPLPAVPPGVPPAVANENKLEILNLISATTFACSITSNPFIVDIIISNQSIFDDDIVQLFNKLGVGNVINYYDNIIDFVNKIVNIYRIDISTGNAVVGGGDVAGITAAVAIGGAGIAAGIVAINAVGGAAVAAGVAIVNSLGDAFPAAGAAIVAIVGAAGDNAIVAIAAAIAAAGIAGVPGVAATPDNIITITAAGVAAAEHTEYNLTHNQINATLANNNLINRKLVLSQNALLYAARAAYAIIKNARISENALRLKRISDSKNYPKLTFSIKEVIKNIDNSINLKDAAVAAAAPAFSTRQKLGKYIDALEASVKAIDSAALLAIGTNENIPRLTTLPIPFRNAREELRFDMYSEVNLGDNQDRIKIKNEKIFKSELLSIFAKRSYVFLEHSNVHIKTLDTKVITEVISSLTKINLQYKNAVPYFKNLHDVEVKKGGINLSLRKQKEKDLEKARENVEISNGNLDFVVTLKKLIESMEPNIGEIRKFIYDSTDNFIELQKAVVESKNKVAIINTFTNNFSSSSESIIEISDRVYKSVKSENKFIEKESSKFIEEAEKAKADAEYAEERIPVSLKENEPAGVFGIRRDKYMPGYITRVKTEYEKIKRGNASSLQKRQFLALSMYILNGEIARMNHSIYATRIVKQGIYEEDIDAPVLRLLRNEMIKQSKMVTGMRAEIYETRDVLTKLKESNTLIVYGGADAAVETNKEEAKKAQREARFAMEEARSLFELIKPGKEPDDIRQVSANGINQPWLADNVPLVKWYDKLLRSVIGINAPLGGGGYEGNNEDNWYADGNSAVESTLASARSQVKIAKIRGLTSNETRKATDTLFKLNLIITTFVRILVKNIGDDYVIIEPGVSEMKEKIAELIKNIAEIREVLADLLNLVETGGNSAAGGAVVGGDGSNCDKGEKKKILGELQNAMNIIFNRTMTYMSRAGIKFDTYNQVAESNTFNYVNSIIGNDAGGGGGGVNREADLILLMTAAVDAVIDAIVNSGGGHIAIRRRLDLIFDRDHAIVANMFRKNPPIDDNILNSIHGTIQGAGPDVAAYINSIREVVRTTVQSAVTSKVSDDVVKRAAAAATIVAAAVISKRARTGVGFVAAGQGGAIAGAIAANIIQQNAIIVGQVASDFGGANNQAANSSAGTLAAERAARFIIEENPLLKGEIAQEGAQKDVIIREKNAAVDKFLVLVPEADAILGISPSDATIVASITNTIDIINIAAIARWNDDVVGNAEFSTREGKGIQPNYNIPLLTRFDGSDNNLAAAINLILPNAGDINGETPVKGSNEFIRHEQRLKNHIRIVESKINMATDKINELKQTYNFQSIDSRVTAEVTRYWNTYLENNIAAKDLYLGNSANDVIVGINNSYIRAGTYVRTTHGNPALAIAGVYIQAAFPPGVAAHGANAAPTTRKNIQTEKNRLLDILILRNKNIFNTYLASLENTKNQLENALRPYKEKLEEIQKAINIINDSDDKIAKINDKIANITSVGGGGLGASNIGLSPMSVASDIVYKVKRFVGSSSLKKDISERNKIYGDLYGALRFVINVDNKFFQKLDGDEFDNFAPETKIKICNAIDELDKSGKLLTTADDSIASLPEPKDEEESKKSGTIGVDNKEDLDDWRAYLIEARDKLNSSNQPNRSNSSVGYGANSNVGDPLTGKPLIESAKDRIDRYGKLSSKEMIEKASGAIDKSRKEPYDGGKNLNKMVAILLLIEAIDLIISKGDIDYNHKRLESTKDNLVLLINNKQGNQFGGNQQNQQNQQNQPNRNMVKTWKNSHNGRNSWAQYVNANANYQNQIGNWLTKKIYDKI